MAGLDYTRTEMDREGNLTNEKLLTSYCSYYTPVSY